MPYLNTRLHALMAMGLLLLAAPGLHAQDASAVAAEIRGDVNGDGRITAADAEAVRAYLVRGTVPEGRSIMPAGDANADGRVTAADAALISRYAAGVDVSRFPVGRRVGDERMEETDISRSKLVLFDCSTSAATGATSCRTVTGGSEAASLNIIVGSEGVQLDTSGTSVSNGNAANPDTVTWTWTLTNTMAQPIGTTDGVNPDPAGSRLFFVKLPFATGAVPGNTRPLKNLGVTPVGASIGSFSSAQGTSWNNRQFYQFDGVLEQNESAAEQVSFVYDARVTTFSYQLLLATPVPFDRGRVILTALADSVVRTDTTFTIPSRAVNHLAQDTADVLSWTSSNPAVATVDPTTGLVTTLTEGATTITATDATTPTRTAASENIVVDRFPTVVSTTPANGGVNISPDTDIVVVFSEAVTVSATAFDLKCPAAGSALPYTIAGSGTATITVTPDADLPAGTACEVTVKGNQVEDVDTNDGPNFMPGQYVFAFEVGIQAVNDAFGTVTTGNVRINSANTDPAFSVTTNDKLGPSTTITFAGWSGTAGKTQQGGDVVMTTSGAGMGQFTYNPPAGFTGVDSLEYTIDSGGGSSSASAKVELPVNGMIWFVNNAAAACTSRANGCGRLTNPYSTLAAFQAENNGTGNNPAAADNIFLYESASSYTGPVTLLTDQKLIGQDAGGTLSAHTGVTPATGSDPLPVMNPGADAVTIAGASGGVALGSNNVLNGFAIATTGGTALSGSNFGTPQITGVTIAASGGPAISLQNGTVNSTFANVSSTGSTGRGISLTNVNGGITFTAGSISGAAQSAFFVSGGDVDVTWPGTISQANNAALVDVQGSHTGTLAFSGTVGATNGAGLQFNAAQGIYNFTGTTTLGGTDAGIDITNGSAGTFTFGTGTAITNSGGTGVNVYGSPANVTYSGSITKSGTSTGRLVEIGEQTATGAVTFNTGTLSATSSSNLSTGISLSNADGAVNFNGTVTLNGGDAGVDIVSGSSGNIVFGSGTAITNPSGEALRIFNGAGGDQAANVSFAGSITTNAGRPVLIEDVLSGSVTVSGSINATAGLGILVQNNSGGTMTFSNATQSLTTGSNAAVTLASNTGATVNFTGGTLDIDVTSGAGFTATGGGTVNVTGANNTVNATSGGVAVNVTNTTIGGSGLNFLTVAANGGANGIVLNNTGTTGGLTVTGSGSAGSGGTIQNTTGAGISLTSTTGPSFGRMIVQNTGSHGIYGALVNNFSLTNSTVTNSGTSEVAGRQESNVSFYQNAGTGTERNVTGTVTITGNTLTNALHHGINITQYDGTIASLNVSNNTFTSATSSVGSTGATASKGTAVNVNLIGSGGTIASLTSSTISNNVITGFPGNAGILFSLGNANTGGPSGSYGSAADSITIQSNRIRGHNSSTLMNTQAVNIAVNGRGTGFFRVLDNGTAGEPITNVAGHVINLSSFGAATLNVRVHNNRIVANNTVGSNGISMGVDSAAGFTTTTVMNAVVSSNNISATNGSGILGIASRSGTLNARYANNVIGAPATSTYGLQLRSAASTTNTGTVCFDITGNNVAAGPGGTFPGIGLRRQSGSVTNGPNVFGITGLSPSPAGTPTVESYVGGKNTSTSGSFGTAGVGLASASTGFTSCTLAF